MDNERACTMDGVGALLESEAVQTQSASRNEWQGGDLAIDDLIVQLQQIDTTHRASDNLFAVISAAHESMARRCHHMESMK